MRTFFYGLCILTLVALFGACDDSDKNGKSDNKNASDENSSDTDGDTDSDSDNDMDTDSDADSDADGDADGDTDNDTDADSDTDGDADDDTNGDSDTDTDSDTDWETDDDTETASDADTWWQTAKGISWDWQLDSVDTSHDVEVYDIDWEESASIVLKLHNRGIKAICYVSVGSYEEWRSDAEDFESNPEVLGKLYYGWPGEKFIDIRSSIVRDIMEARFDICRDKGFDAIEPDNQDVYDADSGFPLTRADGLEYAKWLAREAHDRGMAIVQKNASELADDLFDLYDGALTEDCYDQGNWCGDMDGYIDRNKPVFMCEYTDTGVNFDKACDWAIPLGYSPILKDRDLTTSVEFCQ
jgi:hypothetical protein